MKLTEANNITHLRHEHTLDSVIIAMTELHFKHASQLLQSFADDLAHHMRIEETFVQPLIETTDNKLARQVEGDHKILLKSLKKCQAILKQLIEADYPNMRLLMVKNLDGFIRLRAVLEHHTIRETDLVYTYLDQQNSQLPEHLAESLKKAD